MLKFSKVSKIFGDTPAVRDISFAVDEHEFVLITGPSGSGKTTLMKLLIKEYIPTTGNIYYFDKLLAKIKRHKIPQHRRQIGVVFQDYKLLSEYNVWENIALPLFIANKPQDEIERRVTDLLKLVKLTDKALMFPVQLSGGEAQRISIARALATGPKLIFADEPTGNLDPKTSLDIINLLNKINELGTTILLATHDKVILDALTKIRQIKLKKGEIVEDTKPKASCVKKQDDPKPQTDKPQAKKAKIKVEIIADKTKKQQPAKTSFKPKTKPKTRLGLGLAKLNKLFKKKKSCKL